MELDFSKKIATSKAAVDCSPALINLAIAYRGAQILAHAGHNAISGPTFFSDHAYLEDLYGTYESAYDDLIEKVIGLGGSVDFPLITSKACSIGASFNPQGKSADEIFQAVLTLEKQFCVLISSALAGGCTNGIQNLLQDLCDQAERRQYKLGQRLK